MGDTATQHNHWNRHTLNFIASHLPPHLTLVRVATGFFSVPGYHQLRQHIGHTNAHVLVGFDEDARAKLVTTLIEEVLAELRGWHADRYEAIRELVDGLGTRLRLTQARVRSHDHAKVYILGAEAVIVGSSNLSQGGLIRNSEATTVLREPRDIEFWTNAFDERWHAPDTLDVTEELRERLLAWLQLNTPWEVYLRAAFLLLDGAPPAKPSARYRQPTEYQQVVVHRITKQLADPDRRSAFLIASTGLGKTIMATAAALELRRMGVVNRVLVFAPKLVKGEWARRLESAHISARVFTIDVLFKAEGLSAADIVDALEASEPDTLIVIDESHRLRNRLALGDSRTGPIVRLASQRIEDAIARSGARALLLTATPYAADITDIANQMALLPKTSRRPNGAGMLHLFDTYPWSVDKVEDLIESPVATILNTPFVARHFAKTDAETGAEFVDFPDGSKQFLPRLNLIRANVDLPCEARMADLLNRGVLRHHPFATPVRHEWRQRVDLAESNVAIAWASSPRDLARTLREIANGDHEYPMVLSKERLQAEIQPILGELQDLNLAEDVKFRALLAVVVHARTHGQKVVVYSERLETVMYLADGLAQYQVDRVASVVEPGEASAQLKSSKTIEDLIMHFAPISNTERGKHTLEDRYDVLLATDALSEGINLQDAGFLVSYDLAWTADTIIQRAGRILRLWREPRTVELYTFIPLAGVNVPHGQVSRLPFDRLERLNERLAATETYTELPLIPEGEQMIDRLGELSKISMLVNENLDPSIAFDPALDATSNVLLDYTRLRDHRDEAERLGDDLLSARIDKRVKRKTLVSVIRHQDRLVNLRFVDVSVGVEEITDDVLFEHLRCGEDEPTALVDVAVVERMRFEAVRVWREVGRVGEGELVEHVCSVLLVANDLAPEELA